MIEVLQAGPLCSVQDLGRAGYRHQGVSRAGALDNLSLILANRLTGNADTAAGLEMLLGGCRFRFQQDTWFALTGCECFSTLDEQPVLLGWRTFAKAGQVLTIGTPRNGLCAYLAVAGGIDVPHLMGSRSTDLQAQFGGISGRKMQAGDLLPVAESVTEFTTRGILLPDLNNQIKVLPGPEFHQFSKASQQVFFHHGWMVTTDSNRMGFRLSGEILQRTEEGDLLSHGVFPGVIQVPPNGQPIILAAEAQATGGYPRIGVVIDCDLWKLGQLRPGMPVHFVAVDQEQARKAQQIQQTYLARIAMAIAM